MKPLGSEIFGTANMRTDEYVLFVKSAVESGVDLETASEDATMIDEMLQVQKIQSISRAMAYTNSGKLRKDANLQGMLNTIIENRT